MSTLIERWQAEWPEALAVWSKFTRLQEPSWISSPREAKREGLVGSFACIRLTDQRILIDLETVDKLGVSEFGREILAHEIGHHVFCPADLTDNARMLGRIRRALGPLADQAPLVANLYSDLLINDRLHRQAGLRMAEVYRRLRGADATTGKVAGARSESEKPNSLWVFYQRTYEILWNLPRGDLIDTNLVTKEIDVDASLGARLVRVFAGEWLRGSGRFGALCLRYLQEADGTKVGRAMEPWIDTPQAGQGGFPDGLAELEPGEDGETLHPALDPEVTGLDGEGAEGEDGPQGSGNTTAATAPDSKATGNHAGQARPPWEYGQILRTMNPDLSDDEIYHRYYRELALKHLVPFPAREIPESSEPLIEGLDSWDVGSPVEEIDFFETAMKGDPVIPGVTTVRRLYGTSPGSPPSKEPVDLDLYIDSSGSMPNPRANLSYLTLAGAIIALSAFRAGARVKACLWSGPQECLVTRGFTRNEAEVFKVITGYFGGCTAFPIHELRETYQSRKPGDRPVHLLQISDDGIDTMFQKDETGRMGWDISAMALEKARGGGTMALNLWAEVGKLHWGPRATQQGWKIHVVKTWEDLIAFARAFSRQAYGDPEKKQKRPKGNRKEAKRETQEHFQ